jgi:hypothetical protein
MVVCVIGLAGRAEDKTEWQTHKSDKGNYSIEFPGKPTPVEKSSTSQAVLEVMDGKAVYISAYTSFPNKVDLKGPLPKQVLDQSMDRMKESLKGKVLTSKDVTVDKKYPARDVDLDAPGIGVYRVRIIITEERMYQTVVLGPKEFVEGADAKKFLGSFKITQ